MILEVYPDEIIEKKKIKSDLMPKSQMHFWLFFGFSTPPLLSLDFNFQQKTYEGFD